MTFDEELERALDRFSGRIQEEVARQVRVVGDELTVVARDASQDDGGAAGRLVEGIRAFDGARSLSDILDILVRRAGQEASRVGLLLVHGNGGTQYRGWRLMGFGPSISSSDSLDIEATDAGVIAQATRTAALASTEGNRHAAAPAFAELPLGHGCVAVPLALCGQVVAVLYADGPNPEPGARSLVPGTLNPGSLEILARHAARCLEALTAIKAARSVVVTPDPPSVLSPPAGDDLSEERASARRYARILVSEIRLYHEAEVAAGRRERDLATRLGGEIARARALYEERVPFDVRRATDYVHEELIRTLADGDASLLEVKV